MPPAQNQSGTAYVLGRRSAVTLSLHDPYQWHPAEDRGSQCLHEVMERRKQHGAKEYNCGGRDRGESATLTGIDHDVCLGQKGHSTLVRRANAMIDRRCVVSRDWPSRADMCSLLVATTVGNLLSRTGSGGSMSDTAAGESVLRGGSAVAQSGHVLTGGCPRAEQRGPDAGDLRICRREG